MQDTEHSLNTLRHACIMDGQGQAWPNLPLAETMLMLGSQKGCLIKAGVDMVLVKYGSCPWFLPFAEMNMFDICSVGFKGNRFHNREYDYCFQGAKRTRGLVTSARELL